MDVLVNASIQELNYEAYQQRQVQETEKKRWAERAKDLKVANHFRYENRQWKGLSYEGFAVVSMLDANPGNTGVSQRLREIQSLLSTCFNKPSTCYMLPTESFHQTIANTLSNSRFRENVKSKGLTDTYPALVGKALENIPASVHSQPIAMRLAGLSLFSNAIGLLGIFDNENDFKRILNFREHLYTDPTLNQLTITRTRPFIGHITLAYLEKELSRQEKALLINTGMAINNDLGKEALHFSISQTELRSYQDLSHFHHQPGYPNYSFVCS
ncbi:MAG: hypothetical protein V4714_04575 [Bacteroidota bacterium]